MRIVEFTADDIREASALAYPIWGVGHAGGGNGEEFGMLMCEYIVRYGWYGAPYAFKVVDDEGKMLACILAGNHTIDNGYNEWLEKYMPSFDGRQCAEAVALRAYFVTTASKVHEHMTDGKSLYLSFFLSSVPGCGKLLLAELMRVASDEGYESLFLWTDSSCDHDYYAHHGFEKIVEFKSEEWKSDNDDYMTYIYSKQITM